MKPTTFWSYPACNGDRNFLIFGIFTTYILNFKKYEKNIRFSFIFDDLGEKTLTNFLKED